VGRKGDAGLKGSLKQLLWEDQKYGAGSEEVRGGGRTQEKILVLKRGAYPSTRGGGRLNVNRRGRSKSLRHLLEELNPDPRHLS